MCLKKFGVMGEANKKGLFGRRGPLKRFQELYINLSYPGWICLPVLN